MKTIKELMEQHIPNSAYGHYSNYQIEQMLKEYGTMVVEECAEKVETKSEIWYNGEGESESYDVVDKESILKVKKLIK